MNGRAVAVAVLCLAAGFLIGRLSSPASVPVQPVPAPPAAPPAQDPETQALRAELQSARERIELLNKEIAEQDRRRLALEAGLSKPPEKAPPPSAGAGPTGSPYARKLLEWADALGSQAGPPGNGPDLGTLGREFSVDLSTKTEAQDGFLEAFRAATERQAVMLWDIGAGTFLQNQVPACPTRLKDGLWALFQQETSFRKRGLLAGILKIQGDVRATNEMLEKLREGTTTPPRE